MQILQIVVDNLRAIAHLDLSFADENDEPRRRVILAGANGSGKTTLLDVIAAAYSHSIFDDKMEAQSLGGSDVRDTSLPTEQAVAGKTRGGLGAIRLSITDTEQVLVKQRIASFEKTIFDLRELIGIKRGWVKLEVGVESVRREPNALLIPDSSPYTDSSFTLIASFARPIGRGPAVLLPANRGGLSPAATLRLADIDDFEPRRGCLSSSPERFENHSIHLALAYMAPPHQDRDGRVARMWQVLAKYFPELPRPVRVEGFRLLFETRDGFVVGIDRLSAGERALLLLFAEVALRDPVDGVVLIDEIEQHLHPRWQTAVLEALPALVPTAQFIFTTQSTYVVAAARDDVVKIGDWGRFES